MISVRKASVLDIATLVNFQLNLAHETERITLDPKIILKGMQALFDDPSKGTYYIAEDEKDAIGCHMITYEWSDWRNGVVWWLQSVYVVDTHRKKGVFKKMYDNIIDIINKDSGIIGLRLYVDKSNAAAMKVYESMGMDGSHYTVYEWIK